MYSFTFMISIVWVETQAVNKAKYANILKFKYLHI